MNCPNCGDPLVIEQVEMKDAKYYFPVYRCDNWACKKRYYSVLSPDNSADQ